MRIIVCFQFVHDREIALVGEFPVIILDIDDHSVELGLFNQLKYLFISSRIAYRMAGEVEPPYFYRRVIRQI